MGRGIFDAVVERVTEKYHDFPDLALIEVFAERGHVAVKLGAAFCDRPIEKVVAMGFVGEAYDQVGGCCGEFFAFLAVANAQGSMARGAV